MRRPCLCEPLASVLFFQPSTLFFMLEQGGGHALQIVLGVLRGGPVIRRGGINAESYMFGDWKGAHLIKRVSIKKERNKTWTRDWFWLLWV